MITYCVDTPLNRLIVAINHYISTGDMIGMGPAVPDGPHRIAPLILVNRSLEEDTTNFACFRSRFDELAAEFDTDLKLVDRHGPFDFWTFSIRTAQVDLLAKELRKRPGVLGWGTTKEQVEALEREAGQP